MRMALGLAMVVVCGLGSGCAGYSIQQNGTGPGYDVYTPEPYLLRKPVIAAATGAITGFSFEVIWLPNYSKRYRVRSWTGFGSSEFTFEFQEGWKLTKVVDKADNTKVLEKLVELAKHIVPANPMGLSAGPMPPVDSRRLDAASSSAIPILYKIEFDDCGNPTGLKPVCATECGAPYHGRILGE